MRKIVLITALLFITVSSSAQDKLLDWEKTFTKLSEEFVAKDNEIKKIDEDIAVLLKHINLQTNEAVRGELQRKEEIKKSQVKLYEEFLAYKKICLSKKEEEQKDILKWFPHKMPIMASSNNSGADSYCLTKAKELNTTYLVEANKYDEAEKALLALPKDADATELQAKKEVARKAKEHIYNEFIALKESCIKLSGIEEAAISSAFPHKKEDHQLDSDCENKIEALSRAYTETKTNIAALEETIAELKEKEEENEEEIKTKETEKEELLEQLKTTYEEFNKHKEACVLLGKFTEVAANELFSHESPIKEETETVVYTYFGKDQIIKDNIFDKNTVEGKALTDLLSNTNSESHFGDIIIPQENKKFYFFSKKNKTAFTKELYKFKDLEVEIKDGMFAVIRLNVEYKGDIHTFENYKGISILRYETIANDTYLHYKQTIKKGKVPSKIESMKRFNVKLGDVMVYQYTVGNSYVPYDLKIALPAKDANGEFNNKTGPAKYQIKQSTYLDKIVELRMYTDFLTVLDEGDNGIVNIEGKAKFYIFPYSHNVIKTEQLQIFPSIRPYLNYSRFENGNDYVDLSSNNLKDTLKLVEKKFLSLGADVDIFKIYHKKYPLEVIGYGRLGYNLTKAKNNEGAFENLKSSDFGLGLLFNINRSNNFSFSYKIGWSWYDFENFNGTSEVANSLGTVPTFENQAEVSYFPFSNPNQAMFLKLSSFTYAGSTNNTAFYQVQLGYKFSIGSRVVKKQQ